jgi:hypothetical protein
MTFLWQTEQWWIFSFIAEVSKCRTCIDCDTSHARMRMIIVLVNWYDGANRQEIGVLYDRCFEFHEFEDRRETVHYYYARSVVPYLVLFVSD